jgi:hypothetical protein
LLKASVSASSTQIAIPIRPVLTDRGDMARVDGLQENPWCAMLIYSGLGLSNLKLGHFEDLVTSQDTPSDAGQLVSERDCENVMM